MKKLRFLAIPALAIMLAACGGNDAPAPAACGGGGTAPAAGGGDAPAANPITIVLAEAHPDTHPANTGHREFQRLAQENSNGEITVDIFSGAVLGAEGAVLEQVQLGAVDMMRISAASLTAIDDTFNALFLPYIWNSRESMFAALDGELGAYFANRLRDNGLYILGWHDPGSRSFYNSVRPINTPADMEGLRIRVQETELMMGLVSLLGASPVPMPWGEVYTGIQTGVIDGAENNWPSFISATHYEVAGYFTLNEHSIIPEPVIINLNSWEAMSPEQQDIVRQAAIDGAAAQRVEWLIDEQASEQAAIDHGTHITRITPEQRALFAEAILPLYDLYADIQYHIDMVINAQG